MAKNEEIVGEKKKKGGRMGKEDSEKDGWLDIQFTIFILSSRFISNILDIKKILCNLCYYVLVLVYKNDNGNETSPDKTNDVVNILEPSPPPLGAAPVKPWLS